MAEYLIKEESLRALADLVRSKTGATGELTMQEIMEQIQPLAVVSGVTAEAGDVLAGKTIVDATGTLVEGTLAEGTMGGDTAAVTIENTSTRKFNFAAYVDNEWETFTLYPPGIPTMMSSINLNVKTGSPIVGYVEYSGSSDTPSRTFYRVSGASIETLWLYTGSSGSYAGAASLWACIALIVPTESEVTIEAYYY